MPMDDATRSRLANFLRKRGGGDLRLYAVTNHKERVAIVVVSTCSEEALKIIQEVVGLRNWTLANTATRSIQRNIVAEIGPVCAFELVDRNNPHHTGRE